MSRDLSYTQKRLEWVQNDKAATLRQIGSVSNRIAQLRADYQRQSGLFARRMVQLYKNQNMGFLELIFSTKDFISVVESSYLIDRLLKGDIDLIEKIKQTRSQMENEQEKLVGQRGRIVAMESEIQSRRSKLDRTAQLKQRSITELSREIEEYERQNRELEETSREIGSLIRRQGSSGQSLGTGTFVKPALGWISSRFGYRRHPIFKRVIFHSGIDIAAKHGDKIRAADSGTVIFSGRKGGYGNVTIIDHGNNLSTLYAHQSRLIVSEGENVRQNQLIGYVGQTGYSTGPHLHFEVRKNGTPVDPLQYLRL